MAEHSLSKFNAHLRRDLNAWTNPERNPAALTEDRTTEAVPASGTHSGDTIQTPKGHAGADVRGL